MAAHELRQDSGHGAPSAKQALRRIAVGRTNFDQLESSWDELLKEHEGEWVAAHGGMCVFGASVPEVLAAAKQLKWPLDVIAIDHLTRKRATVLL